MEMKHFQQSTDTIRIHKILNIVLILLILSLPLGWILSLPNQRLFIKVANAYPPTPNPGQPAACLEYDPYNGCPVVVTVPAPPAVGSGYTWNGVHYTVAANADGQTYLVPDPEDDDGGGGPAIVNFFTPPTPTGPPPPSGTGIVNAFSLSANANDINTCDQLEQLKSCLDTPPYTGCSGQYLTGTQFYLNSYGPEIQTGVTGVRFDTVQSGLTWYLTVSHPSGNYSPIRFCSKTTSDPVYRENTTGSVYMLPGMTADFLVGLTSAFPWLQVRGSGNAYGGTILSFMPLMLTPTLLFDNTASPFSTGIVSSSLGVDFDYSFASGGTENISTTNWSTNNAMTVKNWYVLFSHRLAQAALTPYEESGGKPERVEGARYTIYTTADSPIHDLTFNQPWVVADGEKLIVIVDGTLDIWNTITVQGNGFVAFVVKDDITVDSTVGTTWDSSTPVVEGMYIAGKSIKTGLTTAPATARFVGKGMFAAGDKVLTQRDLISVGHNIDTSADLFIYNPSFLVTMPDILKDLSYTWEEVAP